MGGRWIGRTGSWCRGESGTISPGPPGASRGWAGAGGRLSNRRSRSRPGGDRRVGGGAGRGGLDVLELRLQEAVDEGASAVRGGLFRLLRSGEQGGQGEGERVTHERSPVLND